MSDPLPSTRGWPAPDLDPLVCHLRAGCLSIAVYRRRSPSRYVHASPLRCGPVAVLSCCAPQGVGRARLPHWDVGALAVDGGQLDRIAVTARPETSLSSQTARLAARGEGGGPIRLGRPRMRLC
jgi:hypothetical protein